MVEVCISVRFVNSDLLAKWKGFWKITSGLLYPTLKKSTTITITLPQKKKKPIFFQFVTSESDVLLREVREGKSVLWWRKGRKEQVSGVSSLN